MTTTSSMQIRAAHAKYVIRAKKNQPSKQTNIAVEVPRKRDNILSCFPYSQTQKPLQIYVDFSAPMHQLNATIFTCQSEPISLGRASTILPFSLLVLYYLNILSGERPRCRTLNKTYEAADSLPLRGFISDMIFVKSFYTSIYPNIQKFTQRKRVNRDISSPLV